MFGFVTKAEIKRSAARITECTICLVQAIEPSETEFQEFVQGQGAKLARKEVTTAEYEQRLALRLRHIIFRHNSVPSEALQNAILDSLIWLPNIVDDIIKPVITRHVSADHDGFVLSYAVQMILYLVRETGDKRYSNRADKLWDVIIREQCATIPGGHKTLMKVDPRFADL